MIYIFAFLISLFFAYFATIVKDKNKTLLFLSLIPLFVIYAFRGNIGIDHYGYLQIFNNAGSSELNELVQLSNETNIETFFLVVNYFAYKLGFDINAVYLICAAITFIFYFRANLYYDPNSKYLLISLIIFYSQIFFSGLDAVRQIAAVAIFFYATKYIWERKFLKFLVWIVVASALHSSVFFLLPSYFFLNKRFNTLIYSMLCVLILILSNLFNPIFIFEVIASVIPKYSKFIDRDSLYTNTIGIVYFIHFITCILISFLVQKNNKSKSIILINMYLIFTMLFPITSNFLSTKRLMYYFFIGIALGLPFGLEGMKKYKLSKYRRLILVAYALLFIFLFLSSIRSGYLHPEWLHQPYQFMKK